MSQRSPSPRRSPGRRSPSPRRQSPSPRRRSPSPRRRSPSPRRDRSPKRRSPSPRRGSRSPRRPRRSSIRDYGTEKERRDSTTLFIGNLPYHFRERDIKETFDGCGRVRNVKIGINKRDGRSKGYAFVEFDSRRDAEEAFDKFNHKEIEGRRLRLDWDIGLNKKQTSYSRYQHFNDRRRSPRRRSPRGSPRRGSPSPRERRRSPRRDASPKKDRKSGSPSPKRSPGGDDRKRSSPRGRDRSPRSPRKKSPRSGSTSPRGRDRSPRASRASPDGNRSSAQDRKRPRSPSPINESGEKRQRIGD